MHQELNTHCHARPPARLAARTLHGRNPHLVNPLKPQSPKPETRNPKPETRNPKPETRNPKPDQTVVGSLAHQWQLPCCARGLGDLGFRAGLWGLGQYFCGAGGLEFRGREVGDWGHVADAWSVPYLTAMSGDGRGRQGRGDKAGETRHGRQVRGDKAGETRQSTRAMRAGDGAGRPYCAQVTAPTRLIT